MNALNLILYFFLSFFLLREFFAYKKNLTLKYLFTPLIMVSVVYVAILSIVINGPGVYNMVILAALIFSLISDTILMFEGVDLLKHAIPFVSICHILYILVFIQNIKFEMWNIVPGIIIILSASLIFLKIKDKLLKIKIPVLIYIVIIHLMLLTAILRLNWGFGFHEISVACGALMLWFSDIILASNRFLKKFENSTVFTWLFYAPGQFLIAFSTITYYAGSK